MEVGVVGDGLPVIGRQQIPHGAVVPVGRRIGGRRGERSRGVGIGLLGKYVAPVVVGIHIGGTQHRVVFPRQLTQIVINVGALQNAVPANRRDVAGVAVVGGEVTELSR